MSLKFEKRQQIGAKGSMDGILGGALQSVRAGLRLWSLANSASCFTRLCPAEGAADSKR